MGMVETRVGYACYLRANSIEARKFPSKEMDGKKIPEHNHYEMIGSWIPLAELKQPAPFCYKEILPLFGLRTKHTTGDLIITVTKFEKGLFWDAGVLTKCQNNRFLTNELYSLTIDGIQSQIYYLNYNPLSKSMENYLLTLKTKIL